MPLLPALAFVGILLCLYETRLVRESEGWKFAFLWAALMGGATLAVAPHRLRAAFPVGPFPASSGAGGRECPPKSARR